MKLNKKTKNAEEHTLPYGKKNGPKFKGRRVFYTQADLDRMRKPFLPSEADYVAELEAAAKARAE